ncbi:MAG: hypothetical protein HND48_23010 [Chloroflexi bacterium]|nr:hypothetical protein [Chloroflexota bacterium]
MVGAVAWSPDGSVLAVGLSDGELALYNTVTGERIASSWGAYRHAYRTGVLA